MPTRSSGLHLTSSLTIPVETATQTTLIVGKRGGGKSNTAVVLAEEFYREGVPFAVLDPVDTWYGLKAGKDGTPKGGLGIYVFGGEHGDVPLEPTAGAMMADVLVEHRISAVFVLRQFSNRDKARFVSGFAEQLFRRNREAIHLFCEEAHEVMPQQPYKGEEEMLGRMLKLQKLGRSSGIGLTSITQRPASLNKNATTQAEILIAHRLMGPQDVAAVEAWIKYHNVEDQKREVLSTLPTLKTGQAWIWAPDFPEEKPIGLARVHVRQAKTFDSRRTPKPGEKRTEMKAPTPVDLERLRSKMASTIEKAKAEDPKALRRQIADLQRELNLAKRLKPTESVAPKTVKVPIIGKRDMKWLRGMIEDLQAASREHHERHLQLGAVSERLKEACASLVGVVNKGMDVMLRHDVSARVATRQHVSPRVPTPATPAGTERVKREDGPLSSGERKILTALAQYPEGRAKNQIAVLTGYAQSGTFDNYLSGLRSKLYVDGRGHLQITTRGLAALGDYDPLPTGPALFHYWMGKLGKGEQAILRTLYDAHPGSLTKAELGSRTGYALSGTFDNYLSRLRTLELIEGRGELQAGAALFQ